MILLASPGGSSLYMPLSYTSLFATISSLVTLLVNTISLPPILSVYAGFLDPANTTTSITFSGYDSKTAISTGLMRFFAFMNDLNEPLRNTFPSGVT